VSIHHLIRRANRRIAWLAPGLKLHKTRSNGRANLGNFFIARGKFYPYREIPYRFLTEIDVRAIANGNGRWSVELMKSARAKAVQP
jgi:hypothetical protein